MKYNNIEGNKQRVALGHVPSQKRHDLLLNPFLKDVEKLCIDSTNKVIHERKEKVLFCITCKWPIFRLVKGQANRTITICYGANIVIRVAKQRAWRKP